MLLRSWSRRQVTAHLGEARRLSTSRVTRSQGPNARLELDQSFNEFMKSSSDMRSWKAQTDRGTSHAENTQHSPRELEVYPEDHLTSDRYLSPEELDSLEAEDEKHSRKSPAALFGSQRHGTIVVPLELQRTITKLISGSDKPMLHLDAKRLFLDENGDQAQWDPAYDVRYKTRRQAHQHAERDGTAFASVALPSHYAAIVAVLDHVKQRLGPSWNAHHVIDWGSGTGSGLWAAAHVFQKPLTPDSSSEPVDAQIMNSTVATYLGLDKREGLVSIGRRLLKDVELGDLKVTWKQAFQESHKVPYVEGNGVVALSAFMLSSVQSPLARKALVTEMWESGADTIVIIDHSTPAGFEAIAMAREALLRIGRKPSEDPEIDSPPSQGCHVVAPCPHDQACPLYHPGSKRLLCGFSQRLQRPEFVRKTKHSGQGHEDTGYSYVVIRRGPRPAATEHKAGRIGEVGKREMQKIAQKDKRMTELTVDGEHPPTAAAVSGTDDADTTSISQETGILGQSDIQMAASSEEMEEALRSEAYHWPRLVYPPLKKSGHIILDSCTAEGKIMRLTIPRSQGKQPFYDARKSTWGDIFPHEPKNRPQEKHSPPGTKSSGNPVSSQPNGKGSKHDDRRHKSYSRLAEELNENKKRMRKQKQFAMKGDLW